VPADTNERGRAFAALIKDARRSRGLTQEQVFETGVVSKATIIRWESGKAERPDPDQVRALCRFLGVDPAEAAIALGYLTREELSPPEQRGYAGNPAIMRAIEALEDPLIPRAEKEQWVEYLEFLRGKARRGDADRRATG
jgi:transcriptional regulator with XRE-family HTH domain